MSLRDFINTNNIRISDYGNICLNDIFDKLIFNSTTNSTEYNLSPQLCQMILKNYISEPKINEFINLLDTHNSGDDTLQCLSIYIVSDPDRIKKNEYKIGKHKGSRDDLIQRYITAIPMLNILLFVRVNNFSLIESKIFEKLDEFRLVNINGNKSEWVNLKLDKILPVVHDCITKYDKEIPIDFNANVQLVAKDLVINNKIYESIEIEKNNIFYYEKQKVIIVMDKNEMPWFSGIDTAKILGYINPNRAIQNINQKHKTLLSNLKQYFCVLPPNSQPHAVFINEAGFYDLVLNSRKPKAKQFREWVVSDILPSIRKKGFYQINN